MTLKRNEQCETGVSSSSKQHNSTVYEKNCSVFGSDGLIILYKVARCDGISNFDTSFLYRRERERDLFGRKHTSTPTRPTAANGVNVLSCVV